MNNIGDILTNTSIEFLESAITATTDLALSYATCTAPALFHCYRTFAFLSSLNTLSPRIVLVKSCLDMIYFRSIKPCREYRCSQQKDFRSNIGIASILIF